MVHDYMNALQHINLLWHTSVTYVHSYMSSFLLNHHYQMVIHRT